VCTLESHEMLKYPPLAWTHVWKHLGHSSSSWHRWTKAAPDEDLAMAWERWHQWRNGWVAQPSLGVCSC